MVVMQSRDGCPVSGLLLAHWVSPQLVHVHIVWSDVCQGGKVTIQCCKHGASLRLAQRLASNWQGLESYYYYVAKRLVIRPWEHEIVAQSWVAGLKVGLLLARRSASDYRSTRRWYPGWQVPVTKDMKQTQDYGPFHAFVPPEYPIYVCPSIYDWKWCTCDIYACFVVLGQRELKSKNCKKDLITHLIKIVHLHVFNKELFAIHVQHNSCDT